MTRTIFFLVVISAFCQIGALPTQPGSHRVIRAFARTAKDVEFFWNLEKEGIVLDFWKDPRLNDNVDIMVDEFNFNKLQAQLSRQGISYEIMIKDVHSLILEQETEKKTSETTADIDWDSYWDLASIESWLAGLAARENSVSVVHIGNSYLGLPVNMIKISNGVGDSKTKPAILITATIHAREWIAAATATYLINELGNNSAAHADILNAVDFYILPVINPDGYTHTHSSSNNRLWRKTRSRISSSTCVGVDGNRNFGYKWAGGDVPGSSGNPCSDTFRGLEAFSEPETAAVKTFVEYASRNVNWAVYITFHSYGQYFMCPWGYTRTLPPDYQAMKSLSDEAVSALSAVHGTRYTTGSSANVLYYTDGTDQDWAYGSGYFPYSYTMELRDTGSYGFLLPARLIKPTAEETFEAIKVVARHFA